MVALCCRRSISLPAIYFTFVKFYEVAVLSDFTQRIVFIYCFSTWTQFHGISQSCIIKIMCIMWKHCDVNLEHMCVNTHILNRMINFKCGAYTIRMCLLVINLEIWVNKLKWMMFVIICLTSQMKLNNFAAKCIFLLFELRQFLKCHYLNIAKIRRDNKSLRKICCR